ncbi:MAG: hypothetical protein V1871_06015 [Planctomycetota bacterium]
MWKKNVVAGLLIGALQIGIIWTETKPDETSVPPVTKIVFYKHGLGYFERTGKIKDNATVTLQFRTSQMPDLLTSLFVIDYGKDCKITSIGYDSKDPIDKQLENILIRVPEGAALTQFLTQLKGVKVEIKIGTEIIRGNVLGIEPIIQKTDNNVLSAWKLVILGEDGSIRPFNLLEVSSIKILDELLQKDLQRILDIYLNAKYTDRKNVKIQTAGKGERNMKIGYLIEMPIWKTSYRLILGDDAKPYLQGWAIVENPTDEDWNNVQVSFVAGNPISFILDLYTSYYPPRTTINLSSLIPLASGLVDLEEKSEGEAVYDSIGGVGGGGGRYGGRSGGKKGDVLSKDLRAAPPSQSFSELLAGSISAIATGTPLGDLFAYEGKTAVSIGRRQAAMVPIVTENVESNKTLYYKDSISPRIMNAVYLTNATKLTLEPGPINIFEGSTSVGEGLIRQSLQAGMKEMIPYAIESGCLIESARSDEAKKTHKVSIVNGVMVLKRYDVYENNYRCANKTTKNFTLYLDQPRWTDASLMEPAKSEEELPGYYRFKFNLPANKITEFKVIQRKAVSSSIYIQNLKLDDIKFYLKEPYFSKATKDFMTEITKLMNDISEQERIVNEAKQEMDKLAKDQERYRENMKILNVNNPKESEKRSEYLERLTGVEKRMETLEQNIRAALEKTRQIQSQITLKIQSYTEE